MSAPRASIAVSAGPPPQVGQRVSVSTRNGTVCFVGTTSFAEGVWVGIELDDKVGKNDGSVKGKQYFKCKPNHGIFVRPAQVGAPTEETRARERKSVAPKTLAPSGGSTESAHSESSPTSPTARKKLAPASTPETVPPSPSRRKSFAPQSSLEAQQPSPTPSAAPSASPSAVPSNRGSVGDATSEPSPEMVKELDDLQKDHKELSKKLAETRNRKEQAIQEAETLELATTSGGSGQAAEFRRQAEEEHQAMKSLREEKERFSARVADMEKLKTDLEEQAQKDQTEGLKDRKTERELQRLRNAIEVATVQEELAKLTADELELQLEETRANYEADKADAEATVDPKKLTEEEKAELHRSAMLKVYEDHQMDMRALRKRVADLEREQKKTNTTQGQCQEEDKQRLQRSIEQLTQDNDELEKHANLARQACEERLKLRDASTEMTQEHEKLEDMLTEELERGLKREKQLEALAIQLCQGREEIKARRQEAKAAVLRMEARLQGLRESMPAIAATATTSATTSGPTGGPAPAGDSKLLAMLHTKPVEEAKATSAKASSDEEQSKLTPAKDSKAEAVSKPGRESVETADLDVALVAANARVDAARAEAWASCLPESVREDAELGESFQTLCALHRCFHKAQILSSCIHDHYVEDTTFALQSDSASSMRWLCRVCLASAQCAYAAVGILGRLHTLEVQRYVKVVNMPAIRSASNSETALDQALDVLTSADQGRAMPPEVLTALGALSAQLLSVKTSVFKDEPFVSWQSAGCVVEALRAVCSWALYASDDAGGSRRNQWQRLFTRADKMIQKCAARSGCRGAELQELLEIDPAVSTVQPLLGAEDSIQEAPAEPAAPASFTSNGSLSQAMLDGLLVQVSALEGFAHREPSEDDRRADALDRALAQADANMDALEDANANLEREAMFKLDAKDEEKAKPIPPWLQRRDEMRSQLEDADKTVYSEKLKIDSEINHTDKALKLSDDQIAAVVREKSEVEKQFSIARIDAERFELVKSTVARMRNQAQYHDAKQGSLREELKREEERRKRVKRETEETHYRCKELEQQLGEYEKRMQKRYSTNVSPEEVIALRQTCARQQREMLVLQQKRAACTRVALRPLEGKSIIASAPQKGSEKHGISSEELSSCWQRLREIQTGLLFEHSDCDLVNLGDIASKKAVEEKSRRLDSLAHQSAKLKGSVTALLREVAGVDDNGGGLGASFASVALTRHLKATTDSVARGPFAKMKLPGAADGTGLKLSMPVLADLDQIRSMHRALL